MTNIHTNFYLGDNTLIYPANGEINWITMAGVPMKIKNESGQDQIFTFYYDNNTTTTVTVEKDSLSDDFTLMGHGFASNPSASPGVPQQANEVDDPLGITVKHMSKGGGNFKRMDWDHERTEYCAGANLNTDDYPTPYGRGEYVTRNLNFGFEFLVHESLFPASDEVVLSFTATYTIDQPGTPVRHLMKAKPVTSGYKFHRQSSLQEATCFIRDQVGPNSYRLKCTPTGTTTTHYLAFRPDLGQPLTFSDSVGDALIFELTQLSDFPRVPR